MHDFHGNDDELEPATLRYDPKESGVYPSGSAAMGGWDEDTGPPALRHDDLERARSAALARRREQAFAGVIEACTEALRAEPGLVGAYDTRARARSALGDRRGALEDLDLAIALASDDADLYVKRGDVKAQCGDLGGAIADYDAAIELDPWDPTALLKRRSLSFARGPARG